MKKFSADFKNDLEKSIYKRLGDEITDRAVQEALDNPETREIVQGYINKAKGELLAYIRKNYK